ncbi:MAG: hypothetical protein QM503_02825 [Bacteroidota bacterium]
MKTIIKIIFLFLTVSFSVSNTSCSKKNHGFKYSSDPKHGASSYDPVATKHQPIRKKYIVNSKRKTILGHDKPL